MAFLSKDDEPVIRKLRETGVLEAIQPDKLGNTRSGTIFIPCADGHHFFDLVTTHASLCPVEREMMHHPLSLNGGALLIADHSPLRRTPEGAYTNDDEVLLHHLEGAIKLKRPRTVILYAHAPCGMAGLFGLSVESVLALLIDAKRRVRELVQKFGIIDVRVWFHVCYPNGLRRTYHFNRRAWDARAATKANLSQVA